MRRLSVCCESGLARRMTVRFVASCLYTIQYGRKLGSVGDGGVAEWRANGGWDREVCRSKTVSEWIAARDRLFGRDFRAPKPDRGGLPSRVERCTPFFRPTIRTSGSTHVVPHSPGPIPSFLSARSTASRFSFRKNTRVSSPAPRIAIPSPTSVWMRTRASVGRLPWNVNDWIDEDVMRCSETAPSNTAEQPRIAKRK